MIFHYSGNAMGELFGRMFDDSTVATHYGTVGKLTSSTHPELFQEQGNVSVAPEYV